MKPNKRTIPYGMKLPSLALLLLGSLLAGCRADSAAPQQKSHLAADESLRRSDGQRAEALFAGADSQSVELVQSQTPVREKEADMDSNKQVVEAARWIMEERAISSLQTTIEQVNGVDVVTNVTADTVVVNKQRRLPEGYEPADLVVPKVLFSFDGISEKRYMRKEAADALEKMFAASRDDGVELRAVSGYRSYARQRTIYNHNVETKGMKDVSRISAVPGMSEHQTGLAIDVSSPSVGNELSESFGSTKEGRWLAKYAPAYGFVIRYPQGKEHITGYVYEPWHIRYIGAVLAEDVASKGMTLEEYFGSPSR